MQTDVTQATTDASLVAAQLEKLGVSPAISGYVGAVVLICSLLHTAAGEAMRWLPVADVNSPAAYKVFFGVLARISGSTNKNAPVPPSGLPAGGIVPMSNAAKASRR